MLTIKFMYCLMSTLVPVSNFTNSIEKAYTVSYTYKSFEFYKLLLVIRFLFPIIF